MPNKKGNIPRTDLKWLFSQALTVALLKKYRKKVSATFFAAHFSSYCKEGDGISVETARRWLKGMSIPEFDKMIILRDWLEIDLNVIGLLAVENIFPPLASSQLFAETPNIERIKKHQHAVLDTLLESFQNQVEDLKRQYE